LLAKVQAAWTVAGSPTGVRENDHNYDTLLGQGNTLGFVSAELEINDLSKTNPDWAKGLFATPGKARAVVRFSDFGADKDKTRLARMAVKVASPIAWAQEINLLFTESLDVFPIEDYTSLASFAGDQGQSLFTHFWGSLKTAFNFARAAVNSFDLLVLGRAFKLEVLAKTYFGQLAYMLGDDHAMKFSLEPLQKTCQNGETKCCLPEVVQEGPDGSKWAGKRSDVMAAFLKECPAKFELKLQVKPFAANEKLIIKKAGTAWPEVPVTVGTLTIPKQDCDGNAVSVGLKTKLSAVTGVNPDGIDKAFAFHPIKTHKDNRPVGDVNAFRAGFYSQHSKVRFGTMHRGVFKTKDGEALAKPITQMPWSEL
jgi:hypothetical protein